jgi:hypothetical protein
VFGCFDSFHFSPGRGVINGGGTFRLLLLGSLPVWLTTFGVWSETDRIIGLWWFMEVNLARNSRNAGEIT